jgi:L-aspartate oxidase
MIPVAPGAHYSCGGIAADLDGRTSVPGLYAAGEAASTGAQGANRLASNSVTEAVIAGRRTGAAAADALSVAGGTAGVACPAWPGPRKQAEAGPRRQELALAMSRDAGVLRDADGLARLVRALTEADGIRAAGTLDQEEVEAANLRTVSLLIAAGALRRTESRGCHRRRDAAGAAAEPRHTLARWDGQQLVMTEENSW